MGEKKLFLNRHSRTKMPKINIVFLILDTKSDKKPYVVFDFNVFKPNELAYHYQ